ncbi:thioredoxin family protein [Pedobacter miscanthi]|nr:thioredoxin family protein [Pedobacter miscanthi]
MMRKKIIYIVALLSIIVFLGIFNKPEIANAIGNDERANLETQVNFIENSWTSAVEKAKKEHKYIFVDAYAVWCGPCKLLKTTTFRDRKIAEYFNKNFVNLSLDMEKGDGAKLSEKWEIEAYPTLLIVDPEGRVISGHVGFITATDLLKFGQDPKIK